MTDEAEVSLKAFINSIWFKGLARIAVVLLLPAAGYFLAQQTMVTDRVTKIEADRASRIAQSEERAKRVDTAILNMTAVQSAQAADLSSIRQDMSNMDGKLSVILRQRDAASDAASKFYSGIFPVATE